MTTTNTDILIVGASQAGVQLAISLREEGFTGTITMVGEENHRPYQRPALSKEFLAGSVDKEQLIFRSQDFWDEQRITLLKNIRITEIDAATKTAHTANGDAIVYGRLVLATGARARRLQLPGLTDSTPGVHYLRTADDALALKAAAPDAQNVVVIGGGFIGLEAACSLHGMGKNVSIVEAGPRLVGRAVSEEVAELFLAQHRARGLDIHLDTGVTAATTNPQTGALVSVTLSDGQELAADLLLIGIGVIPNTELAEQLGLEVSGGIVVDAYARTSDGHTLAVGDCTTSPNPQSSLSPAHGTSAVEQVRIESVNHAIEQAKTAAQTVLGRKVKYESVPWFWSNQADLRLQIAGLKDGYTTTVTRTVPDKNKHTVLYYRGDQLLAADCINAPLDFMAVRSALTAGKTIPADAAADPSTMLKTLVR